MWNPKNKINEQTKQKQTHRQKEQTDGFQMERGWKVGQKNVKAVRIGSYVRMDNYPKEKK